MTYKNKIRKTWFVISGIITLALIFSTCIEVEDTQNLKKKVIDADSFSGSASCASCHHKIYDEHILSGHFNTSSPGNKLNIRGDFTENNNDYNYHPGLKVSMEFKDSTGFQVGYLNNDIKAEGKMDIVIGSGRKGQSFLSWNEQHLIQLPITYFTPTNSWVNSPGFPRNQAIFNRVITARCVECHITYIDAPVPSTNSAQEFKQKGIVYGIDCEKCHGPGKEHVNYHTTNRHDTVARNIINPAKMSRQQNLDLCGLCHNGSLKKVMPSFTFSVGDSLRNFFEKPLVAGPTAEIDVHGNQLGMLEKSKCFILSEMTCRNCHQAHMKIENKVSVYTSICNTCHTSSSIDSVSVHRTAGNALQKNCLDCHMPYQSSHSIAVYLEGSRQPTPVRMRTHEIKIYKTESDKILNYIKNPSSSVDTN